VLEKLIGGGIGPGREKLKRKGRLVGCENIADMHVPRSILLSG
jgi:hypothetical protein